MALPPAHVPYRPFDPGVDPLTAATRFRETMDRRRSIRFFSDRPIERAVIEQLIAAAGTAPSGAHKQPWRFVAVQDPALKRRIREAAEAEERAFYGGRASERWLEDLAPFGTDPDKSFLETCPWLIVVFKLTRDDRPDAPSDQVYYVNESVGIATGMLISAIHHAGLCTLTHPAEGCVVPDLHRKPLAEIMVLDDGDGGGGGGGPEPPAAPQPPAADDLHSAP
jgi:iodotyrosine deiodinase